MDDDSDHVLALNLNLNIALDDGLATNLALNLALTLARIFHDGAHDNPAWELRVRPRAGNGLLLGPHLRDGDWPRLLRGRRQRGVPLLRLGRWSALPGRQHDVHDGSARDSASADAEHNTSCPGAFDLFRQPLELKVRVRA